VGCVNEYFFFYLIWIEGEENMMKNGRRRRRRRRECWEMCGREYKGDRFGEEGRKVGGKRVRRSMGK